MCVENVREREREKDGLRIPGREGKQFKVIPRTMETEEGPPGKR